MPNISAKRVETITTGVTSMSRFTIKDLRADLSKINGWLEAGRYSVRLEEGGHNGYQAVDEYSVHPDGSRDGSGVNCNICCGTSRECSLAAYEHYRALDAKHARQEAQPAQPAQVAQMAPAGWRNI